MLVRIVGLVAAFLCVASLAGAAFHHGPAWYFIAFEMAVAAVAVAFEARRYAPKVDRSKSTWRRTGERFVDPASGEVVDVYIDPKSGTRDYRAGSA